MSEENLYISKTRTLPSSQDYDFLRSEGFKYIEKLSHSLWTDYNEHDPGITLLETICYGLTELGYRCGFNIADLLANTEGKTDINQAFFTARNILTNEPLTVNDYRKLLIDIDGIHNAFLFPHFDSEGNTVYTEKSAQAIADGTDPDIIKQEVPFFADCDADALSYVKEHEIWLNGLYKILVDLELSDEFGDMNISDLIFNFQENELTDVKIKAILPDWKTVDLDTIKKLSNNNISSVDVVDNNFGDSDHPNWGWNVTLHWGADSFTYSAVLQGLKESKEVMKEIAQELGEEIHNTNMLELFAKKVETLRELMTEVKKTLNAHRNLCEDFLPVDCIPSDYIAFCADFDVKPDSDIDKILATAYFLVEQYMDPAVKFYTLEQSYDKGLTTEEIFNGPPLNNGFIDDTELENSQLRTDVYVSDLINMFMDIEGVVGVRNVLLTRYDRMGNAELPSRTWCLDVLDGHKPVLDTDRSKVVFYKNKLPFRANASEVYDTLKLLNASVLQNRMRNYKGDIEVPTGTYYQLDDYISLQFELPATYAVGENGLPPETSDLRKSQANQLRGYLLLYDQLLADFFKQLSRAKELLSLDKSLSQSYFNRFLSDKFPEFSDLYIDASALQNIYTAPSNGTTTASHARQKMIESQQTWYDRRNAFLDHLMARFAENFNEYVLMMYTTYVQGGNAIDEQELLDDKINFLNEYPALSSQRGKAFDYYSGKIWDTDNVSGLEHRGARLAGIDNFYRRYLFCIRYIEIENTDTEPPEFFFRVRDEQGKVWLKSVKNYLVKAEIRSVIEKIYKAYDDVAHYKIVQLATNKFVYKLVSGSTELGESPDIFTTQNAAKSAARDFIKKLEVDCDSEGFHLLEHILLRPQFVVPSKDNNNNPQVQEQYELMQVCLNENCDFCGEQDPYSFRASVVLPYWPDKFKDLNFRSFFETMLHTEAPAHVLLKICWLDNVTMLDFEMAYRTWLQALQNYHTKTYADNTHEKNDLIQANNVLVDLLKTLHSEYPEARLHDCATGLTNPVMLNKTVLGTY